MMTLQYPLLLLLLLLVPLLVYGRYARRRQIALSFTDGRVLKALPRTWVTYARWLLPVLYTAGLILLIIALARPLKGIDERRVSREAIDMVLLIDVSSSMLAEDFHLDGRRVNRMEVCLHTAKEFIQMRRNDRISVIAFAGVPYVMAPLTFDHGWLLQQVNRIEIAMVQDGTAIGSAIASGLNRLRDSEAESRVIVLLTDGVNNTGNISPENAARAAAALGVRVHAIGAGTQDYAPFPVRDPFGGRRYVQQLAVFDEEQLLRIADITGGQYFHANDTEALRRIYEEIDQMERTEIEMDEFTRFEERFMPFLLWALGLLITERVLSLARLGRWP